ncbi:dihydrolipoyl dehydrogenase [Candidatus Woesearchaeota archaeon]|nr:dihydrolipoyl dehydrogenase [Candidatus Woesearchaeota archaeon]
MDVYDLLVIGSGAGLNVAVEAAEAGLSVCIIEKGPLGGTCLNRGCIPSKIVIHSAEVAEGIHRSKEFGITSSISKINFKYVTDRANKTVDADARSIQKSLLKGKNPTLIQGEAKFIAPYVVQVGKKQIKGKKVLIASGACSFIPPIEGLDKVPYMTSTEALRLTKLPKSMIVIGGGYIGCELGNFYGALGCKVTILQRGDLLLPREDVDVAKTFTNLWKKKFNIILNASAIKVSKKGNLITVTAKVGNKTKTFTAEKILVATGVKPNSDLLAVEKTGVKTNKYGFIQVNKFMETSQKKIWALGDVSGVYMFRHSANLEADFATINILNKKKQAVDYFPMPHAVFTSPEIAGVGLTEQEAKEQKKNYVVGRTFYKNTGKGEALNEKDGFCKFIVEKKTKKILGCHIMGPNASILIHEVLIAMKAKNSLNLLRNVVHIHPALSEVVQRAAGNVPL